MSDTVKRIDEVTESTRFAPEVSRSLRAAQLTPGSLTDDGTITFVLATPAPVKRWYRDLDTYERFEADEVLPIETAVLMDESKRSIPLLNCHQTYDSRNVVGVVTRMAIEDGQIVCDAKLSKMETAKDIVVGIKEGVLRNFSVGADDVEMELVTDTASGKKTMRAKRWVIYEASVVPVPADPTAQIRSAHEMVADWRQSKTPEETEMTKEEIVALVTETIRSASATTVVAPAADTETQAAIEGATTRAAAPVVVQAPAPATVAAPAATTRTAEETASIALFRSQAVAFGVETTFDAFASAGAPMAELRGIVATGMTARSHPGEISTTMTGSTTQPQPTTSVMRLADTAIAKAEAEANARFR